MDIRDHRPSPDFQDRRLLRYLLSQRNNGNKVIRENIRYLVELLNLRKSQKKT